MNLHNFFRYTKITGKKNSVHNHCKFIQIAILKFNKIVPVQWLYFGTRAHDIVKLLYLKVHGLKTHCTMIVKSMPLGFNRC